MSGITQSGLNLRLFAGRNLLCVRNRRDSAKSICKGCGAASVKSRYAHHSMQNTMGARSMELIDTLTSYREELAEVARKSPFIVFLCGPTLTGTDPATTLRKQLKVLLEQDKFEVVLGEDDGLDNPEIHEIGINAQDNELEFVQSNCGAVIIIAASAGSFCELALFSWHLVHDEGVIDIGKTDCIVLIEEKYKADRSYLNLGPAAAAGAFGKVEFIDFASYDPQLLIERLRYRRGVTTIDNKRGRPRKKRR